MENQENTKARDAEQIWSLPVSKICPNPNQPRKIFSEEAIIKLADSIRQFGIIQPLSVRAIGDGYELVAGERRLRAAKELGMDYVPCVICNINEEKSAEISIIENLIREDLNIFEQASAIQTLIDTYGLTQEQIATKLSNSQSFVANKLRLLRLSQNEREKILENKLSERHARALLRIYDPELREKVLNKIISEGMNVARSEEEIDKIIARLNPHKAKKAAVYKDIGSFYSAINRAIDMVTNSGIRVKSRRVENENYTEFTILIPREAEDDATSREDTDISSDGGKFVLSTE